MEIKLPLLVETASVHRLTEQIRGQKCVPAWLLRHGDRVMAVQRDIRQAGADVLSAPTAGVTIPEMAQYHFTPEQVREINLGLTRLTRQAAEAGAVAGTIASPGLAPEPFGLIPYTDLIDIYAEQAMELAAGGADLLILREMDCMEDLRAAVLGARQAGRPVVPCLRITHQEDAPDPMAVLLCVQELGIAAFGIDHEDPREAMTLLRRLAARATVPLAAVVWADPGEDPAELQQHSWELLTAGARLILTGPDMNGEQTACLRQVLDHFDPEAFPLPEQRERETMALTDERRVYYLDRDYIASEPIPCNGDLSNRILEAEEGQPDVLLFHIRHQQDAVRLMEHIHVANTPAAFRADTEEALEMALLCYNGRGLADADCGISPEALDTLARGYGAVVRERERL